MPHFHTHNKAAVTVDELVPSWFGSYDGLYKQIQRNKDYPSAIRRLQRGGNGRQMLIDYDTLPLEIREALGDPRLCENILEQYYKIDEEAVVFYEKYERLVFGKLTNEERERYIVNASVLKAVDRLKSERKNSRFLKGSSEKRTENCDSLLTSIFNNVTDFQKVLKSKFNTQHTLPKNQRRLTAKLNEFKKNGYISIVKDADGKSRGNARKVCQQTIELLNNLFSGQKHKPDFTEVNYQYSCFLEGKIKIHNNKTGELYNPEKFKELSDSTVYNYLTKWRSRLATSHRRGNDRQRLMGIYKPHHQMDRPKFAGSLLSIDDRQPPFVYNDKGDRVWFYMALDVGSDCFVSWVHGKSKEGIIIDFYRQLLRDYHRYDVSLPHELECESSLNSSHKDTFLMPGRMFQKVKIEANNARGKYIENRFSQLRYGAEKKIEGWQARPFAIKESNQTNGKPRKSISYNEIVEQVEAGISEWNNSPHPDFPEKSRWEVFMEKQNPNLSPTNYLSTIYHLGYESKTSVNAGHIKFRYDKYLLGEDGEVAMGDRLIELMDKIEGKRVTIKWIDDVDGNVMKAHIYHNDKYICEAVPPPRYQRAVIEQTEDDKAKRAIYSSYVSTIERYRKEVRHQLEDISVFDDNSSKTLNNKFSIYKTNKKETREDEEVEVIDEAKLKNISTKKTQKAKMASGGKIIF